MAAVGSFLQARRHGGRWLVRMEDLDTPRLVPGSADLILRTLEAFGLLWDGAVEPQSRRIEHYEAALRTLASRGLIFACSCSRRDVRAGSGARGGDEAAAGDSPGYPGTCRGGPTRPGPTALRFRVDDAAVVRFEDGLQGPQALAMGQLGDVILRRRDGVYAYQLAVTVDDAAQGVTEVVRGADLLESTGWQIAIAEALGLAAPKFVHLPVVVEPDGSKLAKSRRSAPLDPRHRGAWLAEALRLLRHDPPAELTREPPSIVLDWAVRHWSLAPLRGVRSVRVRQADFAS